VTKVLIMEITEGCHACPFFREHPYRCVCFQHMTVSPQYAELWQKWWSTIDTGWGILPGSQAFYPGCPLLNAEPEGSL
jgi:hypothetical protein